MHGLSDNGSAWQRYTNIETIARQFGLVVIMPSIGRSFYTDNPNGQQYFTFLLEELPKYLKDVFGLAPKREDTLIAGNSMGGFGAFKAALNYPERFAAAASLSGVLSLEILKLNPDDSRYHEFTYILVIYPNSPARSMTQWSGCKKPPSTPGPAQALHGLWSAG